MFTHTTTTTALFIRHHLQEICFGITAVSLMLFGPIFNGTVKHITRNLHWLLRYVVFVLLCTVGYVSLAKGMYDGIRNLLLMLSRPALVFVTLGIYLALAWIAKQQKEI